jgi:hypothetical protein
MPVHLKSAIAVIVLATIALFVLRPIMAPMMMPDSYARRRLLWLGLTVSAFALPNYWAYSAVAFVWLIWASRRDPNPAALYVLLLPILPPLRNYVPGFGLVNNLFELTHQRLLALVILLPLAVLYVRSRERPKPFKIGLDWLVFAWLALQVVLYSPYMPFTGTIRQTFNVFVDVALPYFVISRACTRPEHVRDVMACFTLSMLVFVPMAFAEVVLSTVFYSSLASWWDLYSFFGYLRREGTLRAQVASGQAIVLGYHFAVAMALALGLRPYLKKPWQGWGMLIALACGLGLTISRGPWVGAAVMVVAFVALGPSAGARLSKLAIGGAVMLLALLLTPYGDKVISYLPFIGDVDSGSVDYRRQILDLTWVMVQERPFFGSVFARNELEELRQGQGIIDIVNTYAAFAMAFGLVGVAIFVSCFLVTLAKLWKASRQLAGTSVAPLPLALMAALVGVMVILATVSNYLTIPNVYWCVIACGIALARMASTARVSPAPVRPRYAGAYPGAARASRGSGSG